MYLVPNPKASFRLWLFLCLIVIMSSCISNKELIYLSNSNVNTKTLTPISNKVVVYRLQPRDILSIKIKTMDEESSNFFNIQSDNAPLSINEASIYLNGYSINDNGTIDMPQIGAVKVGGLTVAEAQKKVQEAAKVYLKNATILVKLVSFKITLLGEVKNPGQYYIYNDQGTVLDGLGLAGDLTDFGNRENITLIRQTENGLGSLLIDLKNPAFLSSEFYYLQPNDVIYVQPLKAKTARNNLNTLNVLSIVFAGISSVFFILSYSR